MSDEKRMEQLKTTEQKLMDLLVENKTEQAMIAGNAPAPKHEEPQQDGKNLIVMIETSKEQTIKIPDNFENLPKTTQRIIMRGQTRNNNDFCYALKNFIDVDNSGVYAQKQDDERKPIFSCRGAILEFKTATPDIMAITAGLELVVRKYKWTKGKMLGSKQFCELVMKVASKNNTKLEITNPPKEEDKDGGEDTGRLDSNKMFAFKKGFKN